MTNKKIYLWTPIFIFVLVLIFSIIILSFFRFLPPKLPLFYSLPWGDEQLGSHVQFFIIPSILALTVLLNLIVASHLHPAQIFFKNILVVANVTCALILSITFIKIVLIFV